MLEKIFIKNYKIFEEKTIKFNKGRNIFVGENGVGKSSILQAISLVLSGAYSRIENIGIESLFNVEVISKFLLGGKKSEDLPEIIIELFFSEYVFPNGFELDGRANHEKHDKLGLQLRISPDIEHYGIEIREVLEREGESSFPFDYYKVEFYTFANRAYSSYNKIHKYKYTIIDTTGMHQLLATKGYVSQTFRNQAKDISRKISYDYRELSKEFSEKLYDPDKYGLFSDADEYKLKLKSVSEKHFDDVLTVHKNNIEIENLGLGERVLLGVNSSLRSANDDIQIVLIEEPENHLSYLNTQKLVKMIEEKSGTKQTFIATHDNMIASRLNLKNLILVGEKGKQITLSDLTDDTARFFMKMPNNNILNFLLAKKVILVEGDAEYILMEQFYNVIRKKLPYQENVAIISCGGKTFKRYIEIAKRLEKRIAVITDNDKDFTSNISSIYDELRDSNIEIFSDELPENYTFEVCLYNENKRFYDESFYNKSMTKGVASYLINNKAEAAFRLVVSYPDNFIIPKYIKEAILWVSPTNE